MKGADLIFPLTRGRTTAIAVRRGQRRPGKPLAGKALLSLNLKVADTSPKLALYPRAVSL